MAADEASTRFPFISLDKAVARAQQIFGGDRSGKPMSVPAAFELWGYSAKSSGGFQTVAALKNYGLLEDEGNNAERRVKLTSAARRFFLDERDDVRSAMLAEFALAPPLFKSLWEKDGWKDGIPADTVARSHLKIERGLNEQSARALLGVFKDTLQYAGLRAGTGRAEAVESASAPRGSSAPTETDREPAMDQGHNVPPSERAPRPASGNEQPARPIVFDMETVTVSARFDNAEDLQDFINKLEKLKPLMPTKH